MGIEAQSVGGGGGSGGFAVSGSLSGFGFGLGISGNGNTGGNGGAVTLTSDTSNTIVTTRGFRQTGILAQSVGGGGGNGGLDASGAAGLASFTAAIGGSGGSGGGASSVTVTNYSRSSLPVMIQTGSWLRAWAAAAAAADLAWERTPATMPAQAYSHRR